MQDFFAALDAPDAIINTYQIPDRRFHEEVSAFTLKVCTPIYWHDPKVSFPKHVKGASCFVLRFADSLIGITANHVIEQYKETSKSTPTLVCKLNLASFDLLNAIIDADKELDIATFRVTEAQLTQIENIAVDCRNCWPPPVPEHLRAISFAGFPEILREINLTERAAEFRAYGAFTAVETITDRDILTVYDPAIARPLTGCPGMPPVRFNMSGCSGGPVLMHGEINGIHRWFPVGLITLGAGENPEGELADIAAIRIRRIHYVQSDGTINRPLQGWLPD